MCVEYMLEISKHGKDQKAMVKHLASRNISGLVLPAATIVLQALVCLYICSFQSNKSKSNVDVTGGIRSGTIHSQNILPPLKQTDGSVVSSKPAHKAFNTAPFSNFPVQQTHKIIITLGVNW